MCDPSFTRLTGAHDGISMVATGLGEEVIAFYTGLRTLVADERVLGSAE